MTTNFNGTDFVSIETNTFKPAFPGAQARRNTEMGHSSLMARRNARRDRRSVRAL